MLLFALILGVALAGTAVLGIWLALGHSTMMRRGLAVLIASSLLGFGICVAIGEAELEWLLLAWVVATTVCVMFLFLRALGYRLKNIDRPSNRDEAEQQFSLWQLLVLTTAFAAIAAVARFLAPFQLYRDTILIGLIVASSIGLLSIAATWAVLRSEIGSLGFAGLTVLAVGVAGLVYYAMEVTQADPGLVWAYVTLVFTAAMGAMLYLARQRGIRLCPPRA